MAEINLKTLTFGVSEIDVNFNGTLKGQADATIPLNVNLTNGVSDITPTSVVLTGNDLDIIIATSGVLFKTIEPSQYTSYRTGDEGWRVQNGWFDYTPTTNPKAIAELDYTSPNFFNVLKNPLVVNGVSSTTRFVDVNGVQVFSATGNANLVVIDKLTGMMYTRGNLLSTNWNNTIDNSLSYSITVNSTLLEDWYVPSFNEINSLIHDFNGTVVNNDTLTNVLLWQPQNNCWTSTTSAANTTNARRFLTTNRAIDSVSKLVTDVFRFYITNARNLITAP